MYSIQHYVIKLISDPFSVASLVYAELGLSTRLLSSGTRDTDFSRSHFLFILKFGISDLISDIWDKEYLLFSIAFLVYFGIRYVRPFLLISGTRNTNFTRSHFLFVLEFSISDRFFSYLGQGILTFLDRISCLFWSSVYPTVFSHIWDKEY
jgi:hypothetical protein